MAQEENSGSLTWFLMGVAIGAACALLYAPKSGKETRDLLTQKAQDAGDAMTNTGRDLYERGKDAYDKGRQAVDDAAALFDRGRKLARG
jgi:gas vesicle protein